MPELPEVETTRRGLLPFVEKATIKRIIIRQRQLRYPISPQFEKRCLHQTIQTIERRSKYLKFILDKGYVLLHLGMSGHLRVLSQATPAEKHDHVDIWLSNQQMIRYTDTRRFGMINWYQVPEPENALLNRLAPEPLTRQCNSAYLFAQCQSKTKAIKKVLMDNHIVVGVGNIYAQECLFMSQIHPAYPANQLSYDQCQNLLHAIKRVLKKSIQQGGTTLKDFKKVDGKPGYFAQKLYVYGRAGQDCLKCSQTLAHCNVDSRTTSYCPKCQAT